MLENELAMIKETLDRTRRVETRLTTFMIKHGMTPPTQKAVADEKGEITLPSLHCSLKDIILATPVDGRHALVHGGHVIGYLDIWQEGRRQATTMPRSKGEVLTRENEPE